MKHKLITLKALSTALIAAAALAGCQREAAEPQAPGEGILVEIPIALEQPGAAGEATKVDANLTTGVCTWTYGDQVAVYVSGSGANAYRNGTVNISNNTLAIDVEPGQSLANYAVYPAGFQDGSNYSGATPGVIYPATYSFTGHKDLSTGTYIMTPMMAVTGTDVMNFYHVGGMLRLALANVPAAAASIELTFVGMTDVCGTCTVKNPGTSKATTAITSKGGGGNVLTVTDFTQSATMYVNVPLPCGDYSKLTAIRVKVLDGSDNQLANVSKTATGWGTLKHGYARIVPVDFSVDALGSVKLSADTPVTLWKSQTIQRTAKALYGDGLPFADATIKWGSNNTSVATVNANGLVTAVGPGSATITATATSSLDGGTRTASYTVYVNTFSVASVVAAKTSIGPNATTSVTATLTHTNHGTVQSFPGDLSVKWTSSAPTYVTVSSPSSVYVGTLQSVTTATGGTDGSSSTITASVPIYGTATADCSITCKIVTDLTFPSGGEKYKFRGYYMHPGSLYRNSSSFSITDGTDPLEIVTHFATESLSGSNRFYFTWTELSTNGVITGTVHANDAATGNHDWKIPTLTSTTEGELGKILSDKPESPIKINSTSQVSTNDRNYLYVNVKLPTTGTYADKGLGHFGSYSGSSVGNKAYQAGMLLVPDGAHLTCAGMNSLSGHGSSYSTTASTTDNVIDYDDLLILVDKGCVFLPAAGGYNNSNNGSWFDGGYHGIYWSASQSNDSNAYHLNFGTSSFNVYYGDKSSYYFPVRVVRQ